MTERPAKVIGAMKHLLNELMKNNIITEIDKDHILREYAIGRIINFGHLAEYLSALHGLETHNYDQIIMYGRRYGESR